MSLLDQNRVLELSRSPIVLGPHGPTVLQKFDVRFELADDRLDCEQHVLQKNVLCSGRCKVSSLNVKVRI